MNFSIEKEVFLKGIARVQGIVEKRNTIPILSNVLIEADQNSIFIFIMLFIPKIGLDAYNGWNSAARVLVKRVVGSVAMIC